MSVIENILKAPISNRKKRIVIKRIKKTMPDDDYTYPSVGGYVIFDEQKESNQFWIRLNRIINNNV